MVSIHTVVDAVREFFVDIIIHKNSHRHLGN